MAEDISHSLGGIGMDCDAVADMLHIHGEPQRRVCPKCRQRTLNLSGDDYHCTNCQVSGDALDLIALKRRCSREDASQWLISQLSNQLDRTKREAIQEQGKSRGKSDGIAEILPLTGAPATPVEAVTGTPAGGASAGTGTLPTIDLADVYQSFLDGCRDIPAKLSPLLEMWGINRDIATRFGIRYYSHEYHDLLNRVNKEFGVEKTVRAGIMQHKSNAVKTSQADAPTEIGSGLLPQIGSGVASLSEEMSASEEADVPGGPLRGVFDAYHRHRVAYLVLPYYLDGRPVFLKALPLVDRKRLDEKNIPNALATAEQEPCLFNIDQVLKGRHVLLFRREVDAIAASALGYPSGAFVSLSRFRPAWTRAFRGKFVAAIMSERQSRDPRLHELERTFRESGAAELSVFTKPSKLSLEQLLLEEIGEPEPAPFLPGKPRQRDEKRSGGAQAVPSGLQPDRGTRRPDAPLPIDVDEPAVVPTVEVKPIERREDDEPPAIPRRSPSGKFIAALQAGDRRMVIIDRLVRGKEAFIRLRYWLQKRDTLEWYMEERLTFVIPAADAGAIIEAIQSAANDHPLSDMPDWLSETGEFE